MSDQPYLTAEGAIKLKAELEQLKGPDRQKISERLRHAISQGDLSENADYHKAKEDQAFLEGRILELDYIIKNAIIIEEVEGKRELVDVGARVTVQEEDLEPESYMLVGAKEADPRNGRISNESPIGKALIGCREGEIVEVQTPGGVITLKVISIE